MKELLKEFEEIKEKMGINSYDYIISYYYTLIRKIEDLTKSRDKWKEKYERLSKTRD